MSTPDGGGQDIELLAAERFDWERVIRRYRLPVTAKALALTLATYANPDGSSVRPGVARLAAVLGLGESTVRRHLDALLRLGLLEREANGGGPLRLAARYRLTLPGDLLDRAELLPPDETTPLTQASAVPVKLTPNSAHSAERSCTPISAHPGERSSDTPGTELRSPGEGTPLISRPNSAHHHARPPKDQPLDQPSRSPQVTASPAEEPRSGQDAMSPGTHQGEPDPSCPVCGGPIEPQRESAGLTCLRCYRARTAGPVEGVPAPPGWRGRIEAAR